MQLQSSNFKLEERQAEISPNQAIQTWLIAQLAQQLSLDAKTVDVAEPLTRYGLDSIDAVTLVGDLEDWLEVELPSTLFWDYPTIEKSAQYLSENFDLSQAVSNLHNSASESQVSEVELASEGNGKKDWGNLFGRLKG